jgi:hypothetical protein
MRFLKKFCNVKLYWQLAKIIYLYIENATVTIKGCFQACISIPRVLRGPEGSKKPG